MADRTDPRLTILQLLRLRDEQGGSALPDLKEIATAAGLPERDARRACDALEAQGYVKGVHGMGGDINPSYYITISGKDYLYSLDQLT